MTASSVSRRHFILRGCQLGGQGTMIGSVAFALVVTAAIFVASALSPDSRFQSDNPLGGALIALMLSVAAFLYSFWFGVAGGAVLAWAVLKHSERPGFSERLAQRDGLLIGIAVSLLMTAAVIAIVSAFWGTGTLPHGASYTQTQQQASLTDYLIPGLYIIITTTVTSFFGICAGKSLYRSLPSGMC